MRTALIGTGLVVALLLTASCSSDKDPVTEQCESACKLDPGDPCESHQNDCLADCRAFGNNAQTFGGPKCATCVISSYEYVVTNGQCGTGAAGSPVYVTHKAELTPECRPSCLSPDGGASGF